MSFSEDRLTRDAFLGGRIALLQPKRGYRAASDPVLLAAFVPARPGDRVLDLGCGAGAAGLCLAARVGGLDLHGLERAPDYAALAERNAALNGMAMTVHEGDVRAMPPPLRQQCFDHVLTNPPFHAGGSASPDRGRAAAHREDVPLAAWIEAGLRRLRAGGGLALIHRADRLGEILSALQGRAGATEVVPVAPRTGRPASRVLVRTRKGRRAGVTLHPPLVMHLGAAHDGDRDSHTPEAERILRHASPLLPETR